MQKTAQSWAENTLLSIIYRQNHKYFQNIRFECTDQNLIKIVLDKPADPYTMTRSNVTSHSFLLSSAGWSPFYTPKFFLYGIRKVSSGTSTQLAKRSTASSVFVKSVVFAVPEENPSAVARYALSFSLLKTPQQKQNFQVVHAQKNLLPSVSVHMNQRYK